MTLFWLMYEFFVAGLFAVGGGLTTLPFLFAMTEKYDWFSKQELVDMIAVSESTPGAIGVNMATYAGISASGFVGGILATMALIFPSMVIFFLILPILDSYRENLRVQSVFYGLRSVSAGLITASGLNIILLSLFRGELQLQNLRWINLLLFALFFSIHIKFKKLSPILIILMGLIAGVLFKL